MRDQACILNFEHNVVWVTPLLSDTCINCNHPACAKRGSPFQATNPNKLELKCGDIVKLGAPLKAQVAQGLVALLLPIIAAIGGYFLAEPVATFFNHSVTEGIRAAGVLLGLGVTTTLITILTRSKLNFAKPIIVSIVQSAEDSSQNPGPMC